LRDLGLPFLAGLGFGLFLIVIDRVSEGVAAALGLLGDASEWTYTEQGIIERAGKRGLDVSEVEELREQPMEALDDLARSYFSENTLAAALEGGGTGLGGAALIAADIPLLFAVNFRLIQQTGGSYGLSVRGDEYNPLLLSIFNVSASGSARAKGEALREVSVAAAAFAHNLDYRGRRMSGTWREQSRQVPREIAKNLVGKKLAQTVPVAGAAVGAGVNYWFTSQTARAAYMLFRAIHIERKERL
ncbi:MAG: EcsC family protein, partial [Anaerolineae bacterium]